MTEREREERERAMGPSVMGPRERESDAKLCLAHRRDATLPGPRRVLIMMH